MWRVAFFSEPEKLLMDNPYLITVASAIAVAAIYFLCVRKLGTQQHAQPAREVRKISQ